MDLAVPETLQQQAFEVRQLDDNFDPSVPPQDGEQYLMHMMYERQRCPAIVSKEPKNTGQRDEQPAPQKNSPNNEFHINEELLPTKEWKEVQELDFLRTRCEVVTLRHHLASQNYDNRLEPPLTGDDDAWFKFCNENMPKLSLILRLNQCTLEELLARINDWLNGENMDEIVCSSSSAAATPHIFDLSSSHQWIGQWLYAVLACLHLPLEPGTHSALRDIARTCGRLRSSLKAHEFQKAIPYNLFIYLIAKVFNQLDLLEFV